MATRGAALRRLMFRRSDRRSTRSAPIVEGQPCEKKSITQIALGSFDHPSEELAVIKSSAPAGHGEHIGRRGSQLRQAGGGAQRFSTVSAEMAEEARVSAQAKEQ